MSGLNRVYNITNPYQGKTKKVLCVCSAGLLRSPTAANVLHKEFGYNTRAVGVSSEYALIPVEDVHILWADEVVVMGRGQEEYIKSTGVDYKELINLNIPDQYGFMEQELQELILKRYNLWLLSQEAQP